eukprot:173113-Rhodomonas_salina.2
MPIDGASAISGESRAVQRGCCCIYAPGFDATKTEGFAAIYGDDTGIYGGNALIFGGSALMQAGAFPHDPPNHILMYLASPALPRSPSSALRLFLSYVSEPR